MKKRTWLAALAAVMIMYTGCQSDSDDPENEEVAGPLIIDETTIVGVKNAYKESLEKIEIPSNITTIGDSAFSNCNKLTSVTIPKNVTSIGSNAFGGCVLLKSMTIPSSITKIGSNIFGVVRVIEDIYYDGTKELWEAISARAGIPASATIHYEKPSSSLTPTYLYRLGATKYDCDFTDDGVITDFGSGGSYLYYPTAINLDTDTAVLSATVVVSESNSNTGKLGVGFIELEENGVLDSYAFATSAQSVRYFGGTQAVNQETGEPKESGHGWESGSTLEQVNGVPRCCTVGEQYTFKVALTGGTITFAIIDSTGNAVATKSKEHPYLVNNTGNIYLALGAVSDNTNKIKYSDITVTINDKTCTIDSIEDNNLPPAVTVPNYLTVSGTVLTSCNADALPTELVIPDGITQIVSNAFEGCTNLTSVTIPEGVTEIGVNSFKDCTSLRTVTLPTSLKKINSAFLNCTQLTVNYNGTLEQWTTMDNDRILMENATSIILSDERNLRDITTLTIPRTIAKIGSNAFNKCTNLTSVTISDSVETIEYNAFKDCASLTSITLPANITEIRNYTFYGCTTLTTITIPDSVKSIGISAFYKCTNLTKVNIPDGVTRIEESTFRECSMLEHIELPNSVTFIGRRAFRRCYALKEMKIPDSVTEIVNDAFYECTSLTSVNIPNNVTKIELGTFYGCTALTSIAIPDSVTSIGKNAFAKCPKLTKITIPQSVKSDIGENAFGSCYNLPDIYYGGTKNWWAAISENANVPSGATIHCSDGDITPDYGTGGEDTSSGSKDETTDSAGSESTPSTEDK